MSSCPEGVVYRLSVLVVLDGVRVPEGAQALAGPLALMLNR